ncbi:hypothetical protein DPMN_041905 [Dreissena polymorpha]|uniref:Flavin-containing monooxygenase n=1 Tax=Dreissena polymorpha TaxID=45954 RepID=A0A9D4D106_DREPO|nr:hypothetical protein DPMN_041905 [Dreissena polymorpha]
MDGKKPRVCIIGMAALYQMKLNVADQINVECYEKQETSGGLWNYTWRTGMPYDDGVLWF